MSGMPNARLGKHHQGWSIRKFRRPLALVIIVCTLIWLLRVIAPKSSPTWKSGNSKGHYFPTQATSTHPPPQGEEALKFWKNFSSAIARGKPSFEAVRRKTNNEIWIVFDRYNQPNERPDRLTELTKAEIDEMKTQNEQTVQDMSRIAPTLPFARGTRGIVTTANNDALGILTTSLVMLRQSGSQLPVEIWLEGQKNYEKVPCDVIYPSLGAKCFFMEDYLPTDLEHPLHMAKFTFKTLAMTFSSFEQVLFLDCDAFPIVNPDSIFTTEPFTTHGMVLWPDYWASTASRFLYEILGTTVPNMTYRATSESGQILVNKATHSLPLLLVTYYNTYGDSHWYPLLSQGAPGEGDKDTYMMAAEITESPVYQVWTAPERLGYRCENDRKPVGSGQAHPSDDYELFRRGIFMQEDGFQLADRVHPRILFVHGNLPKYDAHILLDWIEPPSDWPDLIRCEKGLGEVHRLWGDKDIMTMKFGWDAEKAMWDAVRWTACEHEYGFKSWIEPSFWRPNVRTNTCRDMTKVWQALFPNEKWRGVQLPTSRAERPWLGFVGSSLLPS